MPEDEKGLYAFAESEYKYLNIPDDKKLTETLNLFKKLKENINPKHVESYMKDNLRKFAARFGFLSLSRNSTSPVMWAHYCSNSTGLCIGFECNWDGENDYSTDSDFGVGLKVNYTDKVPETLLPLFTQRPNITKKDKLKVESEILFRNKSIDWDYEKEFRYVTINSDRDKDIDGYHYCKKGSNSIPKDKIKKIILGPFMGDNEKKYIINILKNHLPDVECYESRISTEQYAVKESNKVF